MFASCCDSQMPVNCNIYLIGYIIIENTKRVLSRVVYLYVTSIVCFVGCHMSVLFNWSLQCFVPVGTYNCYIAIFLLHTFVTRTHIVHAVLVIRLYIHIPMAFFENFTFQTLAHFDCNRFVL